MSKIQLSLLSGIRNITRPFPTKGPIADKINEIEQLFVAFVSSGEDPSQALADQIHGIMNR